MHTVYDRTNARDRAGDIKMTYYRLHKDDENGKNITEEISTKFEAISQAQALQAANKSVLVQQIIPGKSPWTVFDFIAKKSA